MRRLLAAAIGGALALTLLLGVGPAAAQDLSPTWWDGSSYIHPFGKTNTATYGQTFTVGGEDVLDSFGFSLRHLDGGTDLLFRAYVMEWNGAMATGSILYSSDVTSGPTSSSFTDYSFSTGGLSLTTGNVYVAFLSASGLFSSIASSSATTGMGGVNSGNPNPDGHFVFMNNGDDFSLLTSSNWTQWTDGDAAFTANFRTASVPEPMSLALLLTGLVGVGAVRRRRQDA